MSLVASHSEHKPEYSEKVRRASQGTEPSIFTDIYLDDTNIVIWQRELGQSLDLYVAEFVKANSGFQASMSVSPESALSSISERIKDADCDFALSKDIVYLVDMFCCLFDLKRAGLRMTVLDKAMCPKFHVDRVPCRLVTTYQGIATEWLPHNCVDRSKLGLGSKGLSDEESGIFQNKNEICQLNSGDVALLKGELWEGNENAGLVHRSPAIETQQGRLLVTLDFMA